jgi:hypothetical protein
MPGILVVSEGSPHVQEGFFFSERIILNGRSAYDTNNSSMSQEAVHNESDASATRLLQTVFLRFYRFWTNLCLTSEVPF